MFYFFLMDAFWKVFTNAYGVRRLTYAIRVQLDFERKPNAFPTSHLVDLDILFP
jgi:hypothetical protein